MQPWVRTKSPWFPCTILSHYECPVSSLVVNLGNFCHVRYIELFWYYLIHIDFFIALVGSADNFVHVFLETLKSLTVFYKIHMKSNSSIMIRNPQLLRFKWGCSTCNRHLWIFRAILSSNKLCYFYFTVNIVAPIFRQLSLNFIVNIN